MAGSIAIGIIGASANFDTSGKEIEGSGDKETTTATVDEDVFYGSLFAEYTLGEMYSMTMGVTYTPVDSEIGSKQRTDATTDAEEDSQDDGTYTAKAQVSNHATIYVEPTFMPTPNFGVYLKAGAARVTVNSLESIGIGEDSSAYGDETVNGLLYGLGMKGVYDNGLMLKLEYIHIDYDKVTMTSTTGNLNKIEADPEQDALRLAIGYQF